MLLIRGGRGTFCLLFQHIFLGAIFYFFFFFLLFFFVFHRRGEELKEFLSIFRFCFHVSNSKYISRKSKMFAKILVESGKDYSEKKELK